MNETIVKTEKLTELKNLVSEIEELKREEFENKHTRREVLARIECKNKQKQLYELIKKL